MRASGKRDGNQGHEGGHLQEVQENDAHDGDLAALLLPALGLRLRIALARYISHRGRRRVQQGPDCGLELFLGDFEGFGHVLIVV